MKIIIDSDQLLYRAAHEATELVKGDWEPMRNGPWVRTDKHRFDPAIAKAWVEDYASKLPEYDELIWAFSDPTHIYWRHDVWPDYKGSRDAADSKPIGVKTFEDWWPYDIVRHTNWEADDIVAMHKQGGWHAIYIDKDLDTVEGKRLVASITDGWDERHLEWEEQETTRLDAVRFFCRQCLEGDVCDGMPGVKGIGKKKALQIVNAVGMAPGLEQGSTQHLRLMWAAVESTYAKFEDKVAVPLMTQARCLRMKRSYDEPLFEPEMLWTANA